MLNLQQLDRLNCSKLVLDKIRSFYESQDEEFQPPSDLLNTTLDKYTDILNHITTKLQYKKAPGLRHKLSRPWKGVRWVVTESWVEGQIKLIEQQEKIINE